METSAWQLWSMPWTMTWQSSFRLAIHFQETANLQTNVDPLPSTFALKVAQVARFPNHDTITIRSHLSCLQPRICLHHLYSSSLSLAVASFRTMCITSGIPSLLLILEFLTFFLLFFQRALLEFGLSPDTLVTTHLNYFFRRSLAIPSQSYCESLLDDEGWYGGQCAHSTLLPDGWTFSIILFALYYSFEMIQVDKTWTRITCTLPSINDTLYIAASTYTYSVLFRLVSATHTVI